MVEQKRTQLFMMLVQQAGVGALPLSHLPRPLFLDFIRKAEQAATHIGRTPIIVYWSSRNSQWLLPESGAYRQLMRDAFCISVFSEERDDKQEEFCFLVESAGFCLALYGHSADDNKDIFQCVGSTDPEMVRRAFQMMLPVWQFLDLGETNRLEDTRNNATSPSTSPHIQQECRGAWPINKPPTPSSSGGGHNVETTIMPVVSAAEFQPPPPIGHGKPSNVVKLRLGASNSSMAEISSYLEPDSSFVETAYVGSGNTIEGLGAATLLSTEQLSEDEEVSFVPAEMQLTEPLTPSASRRKNSMRGLREAWTTISEESREVFPPDAQRIIRDMFGQLRHSADHSSILQLAIEELTKLANADRGLIWQLMDGQLVVTHEFAVDGNTPFLTQRVDSTESWQVTSEFFSRFPDESGTGVIAIADTKLDSITESNELYGKTPTIRTLLELGGVRSRVIAQLRCIGSVHGFLELQQSTTRDWSEQDAALLQSVAETLSVVVQQFLDVEKREMDAQEMKLINLISELFRESKGQRSKDTLSRSVKLVADHMGFLHSQIYLLNEEEHTLAPQIAGSHKFVDALDLMNEANPFVHAFMHRGGKVRMINVEYTHKGDPFFGHDMALIIPLESEGETLGVLGLWGRAQAARQFRPLDDPKLAQTISNNLASIIRADQAIAQIRADRTREALMNKVTQAIRTSPKDVEEILQTLVSELRDYLNLGLCVVSLHDSNNSNFHKSKSSGTLSMPPDMEPHQFAEEMFRSVLPEISKIPILSENEIKNRLSERGFEAPSDAKMVTIAPLIHRENLKAALCLVSCDGRPRFSLQDMNMIQQLAERVAVDISHKELFEQVERQAVTDPMTGLHNRRYFNEQFSKEIDRNQRFGHPFSYIILDLDFLKKINDGLGHQYGDEAIKHIANVVKRCVRDVDTTARFGGEEFVALLPETDVTGARTVAERMRAEINKDELEGIGKISASIGVATFPYDAQDRDKLTELADQALYLAKHRGRNQVCNVSEDLLPTLEERGEDALEVQQATIKAKAEELAPIDLKLIAEHGLLGILGSVVKMIEAKDAYTNERSPRAADFACKLAQTLHLSKDHTTIISLAAILHNIGKIGISEEILQKKEELTEEERELLKTTPTLGAKILEPAKHLHRVASVIEAYHEHWDGTGYPKGLRGEQIPLESRIIALIDAYVAMTSDRPYRDALSHEEAVAALQAGAGKEWDPRLVKLFLSVLAKEQAS